LAGGKKKRFRGSCKSIPDPPTDKKVAEKKYGYSKRPLITLNIYSFFKGWEQKKEKEQRTKEKGAL